MMVLSFGTRRSRSGLSCTTPSSLPGHRRGASSSQVYPLTWSNQVSVDSLGMCLSGDKIRHTQENFQAPVCIKIHPPMEL